MTEIEAIQAVTREQVVQVRAEEYGKSLEQRALAALTKHTPKADLYCRHCGSSHHVTYGLLGRYCRACNTGSIVERPTPPVEGEVGE